MIHATATAEGNLRIRDSVFAFAAQQCVHESSGGPSAVSLHAGGSSLRPSAPSPPWSRYLCLIVANGTHLIDGRGVRLFIPAHALGCVFASATGELAGCGESWGAWRSHTRILSLQLRAFTSITRPKASPTSIGSVLIGFLLLFADCSLCALHVNTLSSSPRSHVLSSAAAHQRRQRSNGPRSCFRCFILDRR